MKLKKTKATARCCSNCGEGIKNAKKIHNGSPYCEKCYPKLFVKSECSKCAGSVRALRNDTAPVCASCSRKGRTCLRCQKLVPLAGIRVGSQVACASCAPHFRAKEPCERCGKPSSTLSRILGVTEQRICPTCRTRELNVTCSSCGKYRSRYALTATGQGVCKSCASAPGTVHPCPDCGDPVGGFGDAPCMPCGFARSLWRRGTGLTTLLRSAPCQVLLSEFVAWCIRSNRTSNALAKFDVYAEAIATLDAALPPGSQLSPSFVASQFSQEGLRRIGLLAQFLSETCLHPSPQILRDQAENRKLAALLAGIRGADFEKPVGKYAAHLELEDLGLSRRSVRTYVGAAIRLWASIHARGSTSITQSEVDSFLRRNAGYRNSISRYLGFLSETNVTAKRLRVPSKARPAESIRVARQSVDLLLEKLKESTRQRERTALTAELLAVLFGVHLKTILNLKRADVRERPPVVAINLGGWLDLRRDIAHWVLQVRDLSTTSASQSDWLFPGRVGTAPLSVAAVSYHLEDRIAEPSQATG